MTSAYFHCGNVRPTRTYCWTDVSSELTVFVSLSWRTNPTDGRSYLLRNFVRHLVSSIFFLKFLGACGNCGETMLAGVIVVRWHAEEDRIILGCDVECCTDGLFRSDVHSFVHSFVQLTTCLPWNHDVDSMSWLGWLSAFSSYWLWLHYFAF